MNDTWSKAISFVLSWEGGYTKNPDDPGGETNFGISKRQYPDLDIAYLTKDQAIEIYRRDYWNIMKCDQLEYPMDIVAFDTAVNMGIGRAQTLLDWTNNWRDYLMFRIMRYNDIAKKNPAFLRGWINRVTALWRMLKDS